MTMGWGKKIAGGTALAGLGLGVSKVWRDLTPLPVPSFYDPPKRLPDGKPGNLIRWEPIYTMAPSPIWRVLYQSTDLDGSPVAVSGVIATPPGSAPEGGWPLLASAHGTTGLARGAAPSLTIDSEAESPGHFYETYLKPFLDAGFAVTATDYQGLGAPGKPSYLIGKLEAWNVLDSIRMARSFDEIKLSDRLLLWGHSQGGQSAAFAGQLAPDYAPELQFDAVVLAAPAADLEGMFEGILAADERNVLTALALTVVGSWEQAYDGGKIDDGVTRLGNLFVHQVLWRFRLQYAALASKLFRPSQLVRPNATDVWRRYIDENTPGALKIEAPVLVAQGVDDQIIGKQYTDKFVERLRSAGTKVEYRTYPGCDHLTVLQPAIPESITWMKERLQEKSAVPAS
jgi:pimeloyl-ACP methyl ester carboxylesterase